MKLPLLALLHVVLELVAELGVVLLELGVARLLDGLLFLPHLAHRDGVVRDPRVPHRVVERVALPAVAFEL